jgi:hypothetical protein
MQKKIIIFFLALIFLFSGGFWFFRQLFPQTEGIWRPDEKKSLEAPEDTFGWEGGKFWWIGDFPGRQKACFKIETEKKLAQDIGSLPYRQTVRAAEMPISGSLTDLIGRNSAEEIRERIINGRPFLMAGMDQYLFREGKNIFFNAAPDKFLFPTVNIFGYYFPNRELPSEQVQSENLNYSNKLIGLPDGALISRGEGVFAVSGGELALIRSPQIFESMGYRWDEVKGMTDFETKINKVSGVKSFGLDFVHPSGTVLKLEEEYFFLWEGSLWRMSEEERSRYFLLNPVVEVNKVEGKMPCTAQSEAIKCCLDNFDPRLDGKSNFPFSNTLAIDTNPISEQKLKKISWSSSVIFDQENLAKRLVSLKNYILYTTGIKK